MYACVRACVCVCVCVYVCVHACVWRAYAHACMFVPNVMHYVVDKNLSGVSMPVIFKHFIDAYKSIDYCDNLVAT